MNPLRKHPKHQRALVVLVLLSLLLQVQSVFACEMMDHSGVIELCCCEDMKTAEGSDDLSVLTSPCCDFGSELTLQGSDLDGEEPVAAQSQPSLELPQIAFIFVLTGLWPVESDLSHSQTSSNWDSDPGNPGTHTYLSTRRLRI